MVETSSVRFAGAARDLGRAAALRGLQTPSFRSPPRIDGVQRSILRRRGSATVSIRYRGRPWNAVVADMIEGIVVTNCLVGGRADQIRAALWLAMEEPAEQAA